MSSAYRYLVFPPRRQPTVEEMDTLQACVAPSKCRYAVGINADDAGLVLAFDAREFQSLLSTSGEFVQLIGRWEVRGCEVRERLSFIKQSTALQPMPGSLLHESVERRTEPTLKRKQRAAQESLGLAGLAMHRTLQQHAWLQRVAKVVPYALMGLGGLLTIAAGIYAGQKLLDSPAERRQDTIERVATDAMDEQLVRQPNQN